MKTPLHAPKSRSAPIPPSSSPASSRHALLICIVLIFGTLALYWQTTNHPFSSLDDPTYVLANSHVRHGLSLKSVEWALTAFYASNWHPLTWISHMADVQLYGMNPTGHHLTNLLLHIANSLLLFLVLRRMTKSTWRSGFVAALFAFHPLHVESVAWIAERKDVLSTFFLMLTLWAYSAYVARRSIARYFVVMLAFALGLMAKPMLVSLPLVLLALDYWPLERWKDSGKRPFVRLLIEKTPLLAMCLAACVVTLFAQRQGGAVRSFETYPMGVRIANALVAYVTYLAKMLWPCNLSTFYPHPGNTLPIWQVAAAGLCLALVTCAAVMMRRRQPYVMLGWTWFVATLVPVIGLVQVGGQAMADRYSYIPLIGLFIAVTWGICDISKRLRLDPKYLVAPAAAVLVILTACAWLQVRCWRSEKALLDRAMRSTNRDCIVRTWMADYLLSQGQIDQAKQVLSSATEGTPGYAQTCNAMGCVLIEEGKLSEAEAQYRKAIRVRPNMAEAHNNLGTLLAKQGKIDEALREFYAAIRVEPYYAEAQFNAAAALASQGKTNSALQHFEQAILSDPDNTEARCRASVLLLQLGRTNEAVSHLRSAVDLNPKLPEAQFLLGTALQREGNLDDAVVHFSKAVELRKNWGMAHASLAKALLEKGEYLPARREALLADKCGYALPVGFATDLPSKETAPR